MSPDDEKTTGVLAQFHILIGLERGERIASANKTLTLPFAPVPGIGYSLPVFGDVSKTPTLIDYDLERELFTVELSHTIKNKSDLEGWVQAGLEADGWKVRPWLPN